MTLIGRISALITSIGLDIKALYGRALPSGGTTGQVLGKTSNSDYAVEWINPGSGSSMTGYSFSVDFGSNWKPIARATISNASISPTSKVIAFLSSIGSGRSQDELEMQTIDCYCTPGTGSMEVTAKAQEMAWGQYNFNYIIL